MTYLEPKMDLGCGKDNYEIATYANIDRIKFSKAIEEKKREITKAKLIVIYLQIHSLR